MASKQLKDMDEALLEQPAIRPAPEDREGHGPSLLTLIGFAFLTFNSGMAVYRSNGDLSAISFVAFSYLDLVLLFYCLRCYERTPPESPRRERLKMAVWLLTTMLTAAFSYKVAAIMPFPVQVLVWAMAGATVLGGFYAFFLHREGMKVLVDADALWKGKDTLYSYVYWLRSMILSVRLLCSFFHYADCDWEIETLGRALQPANLLRFPLQGDKMMVGHSALENQTQDEKPRRMKLHTDLE
ncbi:hypothetical protein BAE44_0022034 [Dichanthelium oligosanthes]|uniref:Uncharacterized protein n=1 Tax=Dichanthelium oligosanthes TaxID=888268 RepID=A0A1E5UVN4_9POAL|nr:hypothetical protein BAE44_0022034 [Dichanthelium oligosanthes]